VKKVHLLRCAPIDSLRLAYGVWFDLYAISYQPYAVCLRASQLNLFDQPAKRMSIFLAAFALFARDCIHPVYFFLAPSMS
jgi:hypothetical protein